MIENGHNSTSFGLQIDASKFLDASSLTSRRKGDHQVITDDLVPTGLDKFQFIQGSTYKFIIGQELLVCSSTHQSLLPVEKQDTQHC